jgi:hypothetical protein
MCNNPVLPDKVEWQSDRLRRKQIHHEQSLHESSFHPLMHFKTPTREFFHQGRFSLKVPGRFTHLLSSKL